jgi:hypothetical protein
MLLLVSFLGYSSNPEDGGGMLCFTILFIVTAVITSDPTTTMGCDAVPSGGKASTFRKNLLSLFLF